MFSSWIDVRFAVDIYDCTCNFSGEFQIRNTMPMKKAILSALLGLATILGAHADTNQVVSVNAVGYVNVVIPPGFSMVCNPLSQGGTLGTLFSNAPSQTVVYTFDGTLFHYGTYHGNGRFSGDLTGSETLSPGQGVFVYNPNSQFTNTFVGEVLTGTLVIPLSPGFQIVSSAVPQTGKVVTDLGVPMSSGDIVYIYDSVNGYTYYTYHTGNKWSGSGTTEPTISVGSAFWVYRSGTGTVDWSRTFSIN